MTEAQRQGLTVSAAQTDMEAAVKRFEAACMRQDQRGAEQARQDCHSWMDALLDAKGSLFVQIMRDMGEK